VSALGALLDRLPRTTLILGKGGVGKTTCATGIAAAFAERGERTLLISTDPAAALGTVIGSLVGGDVRPVPAAPNLFVRQLVASDLRRAFLAEWRDTIAEIIDRGTYLDREDVDGLVDAALPGADEIFALLGLSDLLSAPNEWRRIVVDTAPTGHTLRLLALPDTFRALVAMLEAMQAKHRFMVRALTRRYRSDRADEFLRQMEQRIQSLRASLTDAHSLAAVLITRPEPVVAAETARYAESVRELGISIAAVIVNAVPRELDQNAREAIRLLDAIPNAVARYWLGWRGPPRGLPAVGELLSNLDEGEETITGTRDGGRATTVQDGVPRSSRPSSLVPRPSSLLHRQLTIVGGKGGVGKTTVACALAIATVEEGAGDVLLVSTDPAPSIGDALGQNDAAWTRVDEEYAVPEVPGLVVRQMDATAAFSRFREEYQSRIDSLFDAVRAHGLDAAHDRAILRQLFALAPPGVDELYALSILGETIAAQKFARVIVDPAPTGHLLRLLEMPALALDWSHRLMRLMLKYREITGLGDTARELLDFARQTRSLEALLHDPDRCGVLLVTLDEPVVRWESERLLRELRERGTDVIGVMFNRVEQSAIDSTTPLPAEPPVSQFLAAAMTPPPVGVNVLRRWADTWENLGTTS
jgi:arsenite-transporting ATPase